MPPEELEAPKLYSPGFKKFFLIEFTKQLISHSVTDEILKLATTLRENRKSEKKVVRDKLKKIEEIKKPLPALNREISSEVILSEPIRTFKPLPRPPQIKVTKQGKLIIPEIRLPSRLQYLRPIPTNLEIDLAKINPLIRDHMVKTIECNGPDKNIVVEGGMGRKQTNIIMTKEEIEDIIQRFSEATKIPIHEGIYNVVRGKLTFSAIISEVIGSKFIIKKMSAPMMTPPSFRRF